MDLPESVAAIGEQLGGTGTIVADPQLFSGADVFASERDRLFARPWVAVDHALRLDEGGRYFRFDAATRSILVTRDGDGGLHALRNLCLHAGYPVCEAEEGPAERLVCPYHGWEYALDGRLVEPELSARIDPARLRLASYPVCVRDGLIFVDLSVPAGSSQAPARSPETGSVPQWVADGGPTRRARYSTNWNWKLALQFLKTSPHLLLDDGAGDGGWIGFGPLSLMRVAAQQAILLRVVPKSAERTDIELIRIEPQGASGTATVDEDDRVAQGLRQAGDASAMARATVLDREFFGWYWSLMSPN